MTDPAPSTAPHRVAPSATVPDGNAPGIRLRVLRDGETPEADLAAALDRFERQFRYPLGAGGWFRITHGADYARFYRSMGTAACWVATTRGAGAASGAGGPDGTSRDEVVGVLAAVVRTVRMPDGTARTAAYLGDLKIAPSARGGGRALLTLAATARAWIAPRVTCAYGVVMDGTPVTPERYTGRFDIPGFEAVGKVVVLRVPAVGWDGPDSPSVTHGPSSRPAPDSTPQPAGPCIAVEGGDAMLRRERPAVPVGSTGAVFEDTRAAKRLFDDADREIPVRHLTLPPDAAPPDIVEAMRGAAALCRAEGTASYFTCVPAGDLDALRPALPPATVIAPATVYGARIPPGLRWSVRSCEI